LLLAALSTGALAQDYLNEISKRPDLLQFLAPIIPTEKFAFDHGSFAQSGAPCNAPQLAYCQVLLCIKSKVYNPMFLETICHRSWPNR
jgi:hypothetical protein